MTTGGINYYNMYRNTISRVCLVLRGFLHIAFLFQCGENGRLSWLPDASVAVRQMIAPHTLLTLNDHSYNNNNFCLLFVLRQGLAMSSSFLSFLIGQSYRQPCLAKDLLWNKVYLKELIITTKSSSVCVFKYKLLWFSLKSFWKLIMLGDK